MLFRLLAVVIIIAGLALTGFFYKDYRDQSAKADSLEAQLKNTNNSALVLAKQAQSIETELADIVKRSNETQAAIEKEKTALPERINSNSIVRSILIVGQTNGVTAIPLSTQDWATVKIGTHDYSVFRLSIQARGNPDDLVSFIRTLQQATYSTLIVEGVNIAKTYTTPTVPTPTVPPGETVTPTPEEVEPIPHTTADVKLAIYAR